LVLWVRVWERELVPGLGSREVWSCGGCGLWEWVPRWG
jgi:hypothetical protein